MPLLRFMVIVWGLIFSFQVVLTTANSCNRFSETSKYRSYLFSLDGGGAYGDWSARWGDAVTPVTECYLSDVKNLRSQKETREKQLLKAFRECDENKKIKKRVRINCR